MKKKIKKIYRAIIDRFRAYGPVTFIKFGLKELKRVIYYQLLQHSYSHAQEDLLVEKILGRMPRFYVDVGAYLPIKFNNTYRFYRNGSRGINIEPNPATFKELSSKRPEDINLNIGVSDESGELMLYGACFGVGDTFDKEAAVNAEKVFGIKTKPKGIIPVRTLESVFDEYIADSNQEIDLLSIDTEGYDYKVLTSNNWTKYRPQVICAETNLEHSDSNIHDYLIKLGYVAKANTEQNTIYSL